MKRTVLLPTDFSDNSWSAIVYALNLYKNVPCDFIVLHVYDLSFYKLSNIANSKQVKEEHDAVKRDSIKNLEVIEMQMRTAHISPDFSFKIQSISGDLIDVINDVVKDNFIDTVVMGTKGATGAKKILFGSNTIKVINQMKLCPVLAVPEEYDFVIPEQIAFSTDFNHYYNYIEIKPLKDLASLFDSKIRVVHINVEKALSEIQEHNISVLKKYLSKYEFTFHWIPEYAKKTEEINELIKDLQINILVMVNYHHSFIEAFIKEPIIKNIGLQPAIPFFVIPE